MPLEELHDPAAATHASENGGTTHPDAEVITLLQSQVNARQVRIDELEVELRALTTEQRRYSKALAYLTGETPVAKPGPKGPRADKPVATKTGGVKGLGAEKFAALRAAVMDYASDHEEFRQIDIRNIPGLEPSLTKSSMTATGFEALRQEGVIRLARQEGINKWYRLTRETLRELAD
jgi:hypothetical protein